VIALGVSDVEVDVDVNGVNVLRKRILAEFMDENPATFPSPTGEVSWVGAICGNVALGDVDRRVAERALGMLAGIFRSAQLSLDESQTLSELLSPDNIPGIESIEPDAQAIVVVGGEGADEASTLAFARSITLCKMLMEGGLFQSDQLRGMIDGALEALPGNAPLMRSLIETAKRMAQADLDVMLS
jgi:hypothetical protein